MEIDENVNNERLHRAIKCLQLICRTNPPKSSLSKACNKALGPLMDEMAERPLPLPKPRSSRVNFVESKIDKVQRVPILTGPHAGKFPEDIPGYDPLTGQIEGMGGDASVLRGGE